MFVPPLDFLQEHVHPAISGVTVALLKRSAVPSEVYRLSLAGPPGAGHPQTAILKLIQPDWPDDPQGHLREVRVYNELLPRLDMPQPQRYYAGPAPGRGQQMLLLADMAETYRFPPPQHTWSMAEIEPVLTAYARLHHGGTAVLPPPAARDWLLPRHETRLHARAADLSALVEEITDAGAWPALPGFAALLARTLEQSEAFAAAPVTLLHNDVFPPNAALPLLHDDKVLLIDWEMTSWGLPEMDLSYMFLQPFRSHRRLSRGQVMAWYWGARDALGDDVPGPAERAERLRYADRLWALWLIPVAHRALFHPFPPRSFPRIYWDVMHMVLGERLQDLCRALPA